MVNKVLTIVLAAILLACAFFITDRMEQNIITSEDENTIVAEIAVSETNITQESNVLISSAGKENVETIEVAKAQKKKDIAKQFTVEYEGDAAEHYWGNAFIHLHMPHWEPELLFKYWEDQFPVRELVLEYNDAVYGKINLSFKGASVNEIMLSDSASDEYNKMSVYTRRGKEIFLTKEDVLEREIYLMALCEDMPFGMPADGGTGPFWLVSVQDGKAEVLGTQIVQIYVSLPHGAVF